MLVVADEQSLTASTEIRDILEAGDMDKPSPPPKPSLEDMLAEVPTLRAQREKRREQALKAKLARSRSGNSAAPDDSTKSKPSAKKPPV